MKFILREDFKENIYNLMRRAGYHFQGKNEEKSEMIFTQPARGYPRFHIYLKLKDKDLIFNLHLDQKRPVYNGVTAHSGEYDGKIIEEEAERIKQILQK